MENYIISKRANKIKIYDRNCNHAGGKIISKDGLHRSPQHNWIFDPETGKYTNGVIKKEKNYIIKNGKIEIKNYHQIPMKMKVPGP